MKTVWLFILIMAGVNNLKAQQLALPVAPGKIPDNSLYQYFKVKPDNRLFNVTPVQPKISRPSTVVPTVKEVSIAEITDRMPIAKLYSDDKMLIVKPGDPNTRYTMLIQDYGKTKADSASRRP